MTSYETSLRSFTVEHQLRAVGGKGMIGCMDRRRVIPNDPVLGGDRLFQQIRGGRYGVATGGEDEAMFKNAVLLNPDLTEVHYLKTVAAADGYEQFKLRTGADRQSSLRYFWW